MACVMLVGADGCTEGRQVVWRVQVNRVQVCTGWARWERTNVIAHVQSAHH